MARRRWPWIAAALVGVAGIGATLAVLRPWNRIGRVTDADCEQLAVTGHTLVTVCSDPTLEQPEYPTSPVAIDRWDDGKRTRVTTTADVVGLAVEGEWIATTVRSFAFPKWHGLDVVPLAGGSKKRVTEGDGWRLVAFGGGRVLVSDGSQLRLGAAPEWTLSDARRPDDFVTAAFDARGGVALTSNAVFALDGDGLALGAKLAELQGVPAFAQLVGDEIFVMESGGKRFFRVARSGGSAKIVGVADTAKGDVEFGPNGYAWIAAGPKAELWFASYAGGAPKLLADDVHAFAFDGTTLFQATFASGVRKTRVIVQ